MGVLAFRQEVNPNINKNRQDEIVSRDDLLALLPRKYIAGRWRNLSKTSDRLFSFSERRCIK